MSSFGAFPRPARTPTHGWPAARDAQGHAGPSPLGQNDENEQFWSSSEPRSYPYPRLETPRACRAQAMLEIRNSHAFPTPARAPYPRLPASETPPGVPGPIPSARLASNKAILEHARTQAWVGPDNWKAMLNISEGRSYPYPRLARRLRRPRASRDHAPCQNKASSEAHA